MSTTDNQTNMTVEEAVLEHSCYNCGHVRLDKTCRVYCQLRAEGGRCLAYNSWTPLPEPCEDYVSRQAVLDIVNNPLNIRLDEIIKKLPPVTPEKTTITYKDCAEAMLKMWIDNVLTDGQYNKIMDKLNTKHIADMKGVVK